MAKPIFGKTRMRLIYASLDNPIRFEDWTPPLEAEEGFATKSDWDDAWSEIRAGL